MRRAGCWQAVVSAAAVQPLVVRVVLAVSEDGAKAKNAALRVTGYIAALTIIVARAAAAAPLATRAGTRLRALAIAEVYAAAVLRGGRAPGGAGLWWASTRRSSWRRSSSCIWWRRRCRSSLCPCC